MYNFYSILRMTSKKMQHIFVSKKSIDNNVFDNQNIVRDIDFISIIEVITKKNTCRKKHNFVLSKYY